MVRMYSLNNWFGHISNASAVIDWTTIAATGSETSPWIRGFVTYELADYWWA